MIVLMKDKVYDLPEVFVSSTIKELLETFKNTNIIVALQFKGKENKLITELRNDRFESSEELMKQVLEYQKEKIVVHYNKK